jgi:hypothetical protein
MQRRISKFGRYAVPGFCALALGACFHPAPQEAVAPSGNYGGTVVAYPVGGYGYDGYDGYPGYYDGYSPYLYAPYGVPYGYGVPGYVYVRPRVLVRPPAYNQTLPGRGKTLPGSGSATRPGQDQSGLRPWNGNPRQGQLRPPTGMPAMPPSQTGRIAHPRPVAPPAPPAPRPTVNQKPSVPPQRIAVPRPAPRTQQRPERRH